MAMETPLGHIPVANFVQLVVDRNVRPERPSEDDVQCQGLSDDLWRIAESCWVKEANDRPNATTLCDEVERCLASHRESKVPSSSSSLLPELQTGSSAQVSQPISSSQFFLESRDKSCTAPKIYPTTGTVYFSSLLFPVADEILAFSGHAILGLSSSEKKWLPARRKVPTTTLIIPSD